MDEKEIPFSEILTAIFNEEPMHIYLLHRFSDLMDEDFVQFKRYWEKAEDEKRRVITQHMADISEENYLVDFSLLFAYFLQDAFAPVRIAALDGLWDDTIPAHIPIIVSLLQQDEDDGVKTAAARALSHYIVLAEWEELPMKAVEPAVAALLQAYDDVETAVSVRRAALESLGSSSHERLSEIIQNAYEHDSYEMQLSAVFAMGNSADKRWIPIILNEMGSYIEEMRAEAARAAGAIGSSDTISELADLTMDEDPDVRLAAVAALGAIGGEIPQRLLTEILGDEEQEDLHELAEEVLEELLMFGSELDFLDYLDPDPDSEQDDNWLIS